MNWNGLELPAAYYQDDAVYIIHADCRNVLPLIPDKSIDLVLTDPPYNFVADGGGLYKKRGGLDRINKSFGTDFLPEDMLEASNKVCKVMHGYFWCSKAIVSNYLNWAQQKELGFNILTWHKSNPIPANNHNFLPDTEYCIFIRGVGTTFNQGLEMRLYRKWDLTSIQPFNGHPTPKPIDMIMRYLRISSSVGDLILDPFLGSGTTAYCAKKLGRKCIGIEIEEKYCEIAAKRCSQSVMRLEVG